jgi:ElaB/YqjD/DUF883 family membrane-anchored ribosome-binding protein
VHPLIEAFCRIPGRDACQPTFFNQMQRRLRDEIQPLLDERDRLLAANETLTYEVNRLKASLETTLSKRKAKIDVGAGESLEDAVGAGVGSR